MPATISPLAELDADVVVLPVAAVALAPVANTAEANAGVAITILLVTHSHFTALGSAPARASME